MTKTPRKKRTASQHEPCSSSKIPCTHVLPTVVVHSAAADADVYHDVAATPGEAAALHLPPGGAAPARALVMDFLLQHLPVVVGPAAAALVAASVDCSGLPAESVATAGPMRARAVFAFASEALDAVAAAATPAAAATGL